MRGVSISQLISTSTSTSEKRNFDLQREKEFARHSDICKKLRALGMALAQHRITKFFSPLDAHIMIPQIVNNSKYMTTKDILESDNPFQREGKQVIHVCLNCGLIEEDYIKDKINNNNNAL